jgi:hypothetical protein
MEFFLATHLKRKWACKIRTTGLNIIASERDRVKNWVLHIYHWFSINILQPGICCGSNLGILGILAAYMYNISALKVGFQYKAPLIISVQLFTARRCKVATWLSLCNPSPATLPNPVNIYARLKDNSWRYSSCYSFGYEFVCKPRRTNTVLSDLLH